MKVQAVIKFFGSTQTSCAAALSVSQPAISNWVKRGRVPDLQQLRIETLSGGALKPDRRTLARVSRR